MVVETVKFNLEYYKSNYVYAMNYNLKSFTYLTFQCLMLYLRCSRVTISHVEANF